MKAYLILEDGHVFSGTSIGSDQEVISEIVFNTSMTGYEEILTDPSYAGQAVVMTYPLIGNYGVNERDMESARPWVDGFIVRELSSRDSNFRSEGSLNDFLKKYEIPGIAGIDTRMLTKILRESGTMNGMITTNAKFDVEEVKERLEAYQVTGVVQRVSGKAMKRLSQEDFIPSALEEARMTYLASPEMKQAIEQAEAALIGKGLIAKAAGMGREGVRQLTSWSDRTLDAPKKYRVALMDYGSKKNIAHCLQRRGCEVTIYPADTKAEVVLQDKPDGIMLSNGPGDPAECVEIIEEIKKLNESGIPIFAICLGHQLMALAHGFQTRKMTYGHRGANHPVKNLETGRVYISSQNHGYMVKMGTVDPSLATLLFVNANDNSVEGLRYQDKKIFTVQFHPEACAGPEDTEHLFDEFIALIEGGLEHA